MTSQTPFGRDVSASDAAPLGESTPSERQAANSSLGELVSQVTGDMSTLMRKELELAKAELRETAKTSAKAGAMLGAAGYAGHLTILFLSITVWWSLGYVVGNGWSALIVTVIWGIVAADLFAVGRKNMKKIEGAPQTVETLKEIPDTLKRNEENR
jgi:hypothetical protein